MNESWSAHMRRGLLRTFSGSRHFNDRGAFGQGNQSVITNDLLDGLQVIGVHRENVCSCDLVFLKLCR